LDQTACPHCGQDWLRHYRLKDGSESFWLCPECESLWTEGQSLTEDTENYLSDHLPQFSRANVWDALEQI
jgi:hypothetical protein